MDEEEEFDIPTLWTASDEDEFRYTHELTEVTVWIESRLPDAAEKVEPGEEYPRVDESDRVWVVKVDTGEIEVNHSESRETKLEGKELAVDFLNDFTESYESQDYDKRAAIEQSVDF